MGKKIPNKVKIEVIREWLNGLSRANIATNNQIAQGSVSNIIQSGKNSNSRYRPTKRGSNRIKKGRLGPDYICSFYKAKENA